MVKLSYSITSDHPCQIPVLGTFEAGETKELSDETLQLFEAINGYKVGGAHFAPWVRLTVAMTEEAEEG